MVFKVKGKKKCPVVKRPRPEFFREKEIQVLRKRHKGKIPPFTELTRTGLRRVSGIHSRIYKKGRVVQYKGRLAEVKKVSTRGITLQLFSKPKKTGLATLTKKEVFVSVKEVESGKVYPFFNRFPLVFGGIFTFGRN